VRCPVTRSGTAGIALATVIAASAVVIAAWWKSGSPADGLSPVFLGFGLWSVTAALAALAWLRSPRGVLEWDGAQWWWTPAGTALSVACQKPPTVHLDLQRFLLVSVFPEGRRTWLALEKRQAPQRWSAFRRAVYSPARPPGSSAAARSQSGTPSD